MAFPIRSDNHSESTLDDWMNEFWQVYRHRDSNLSPVEMWAMAAEDASKVGEGIREGSPERALNGLAHAFCWVCSFAARLFYDERIAPVLKISGFRGIATLSDIVWFKYPGLCLRCLRGGCICPVLPQAPEKNQDWENTVRTAREGGRLPQEIRDWERHFVNIYDTAHFIKSLEELGFHYLEEFGEVFSATRKLLAVNPENINDGALGKLQENLIEEIADVISWTFSMARKLGRQAEEIEKAAGTAFGIADKFRLASLLWGVYKREAADEIGCPVCHERVCSMTCAGEP